MEKLFKTIFKKLTGIDLDNLSIKEEKNYPEPIKYEDGLKDNYLFDFKNYQSQYNGWSNGSILMSSNEGDTYKTPEKIKIKPIDVLNELETLPNPFSLTLIDEKISMLKDKLDLINQTYAKRDVEGLLERLENRKKYLEFKEFFDKFQNTDDIKINKLLEKYDLVMKTSDIFIPEFPDEAITIMKDYTNKMLELCNKKPIFYVIATPENFQDVDGKRDPILLVQSPFGFYWQILGAWDKEMLLLSEI